jgi:hypothetical protein
VATFVEVNLTKTNSSKLERTTMKSITASSATMLIFLVLPKHSQTCIVNIINNVNSSVNAYEFRSFAMADAACSNIDSLEIIAPQTSKWRPSDSLAVVDILYSHALFRSALQLERSFALTTMGA